MIANFFQNLNAAEVDYLLISGQATVLYGASTFSEDIDLWISPTTENISRFLSVLRNCEARIYKLTPPLTIENFSKGHGFHFYLPQSNAPEVFLDVMGNPPRAGDFAQSNTTARWMETDWGRLRLIGLKDLVAIKKTQRLQDYPIISNLALAWFNQPECTHSSAEYSWAVENIFTSSALIQLIEEGPLALKAISDLPLAPLKTFAKSVSDGTEVPEAIELEVNAWMQNRMADLQQADRRYWRNIIAELKKMRSRGLLLPEGASI